MVGFSFLQATSLRRCRYLPTSQTPRRSSGKRCGGFGEWGPRRGLGWVVAHVPMIQAKTYFKPARKPNRKQTPGQVLNLSPNQPASHPTNPRLTQTMARRKLAQTRPQKESQPCQRRTGAHSLRLKQAKPSSRNRTTRVSMKLPQAQKEVKPSKRHLALEKGKLFF